MVLPCTSLKPRSELGTLTASPGDGEQAAREGYYPDPSIPGFVRYWNGASWVPGTSRPAPPAAPAAPAAPAEETGPMFLDETSATEALPEPEPSPSPGPEPVVWQADPAQQAGFGGPRDQQVSWGSHAEPEAGQPAARPAGISLARPAAAAAARFPAQAPAGILSVRSPAASTPAQSWEEAPAPARARDDAPAAADPARPWGDAPAPAPAPARSWGEAPDPAPARSWDEAPAPAPARTRGEAPAPAPAPVRPWDDAAAPARARPQDEAPAAGAGAAAAVPAPAWPDAPGGSGSGSGMTSSWPEAAPRAAAAAPAVLPAEEAGAEDWLPRGPVPGSRTGGRTPEPAMARPAAPRPTAARAPEQAAPRAEVWAPRPAGVRPSVPAAAAPAAEAAEAAPAARPQSTARAVFERMAERAVRPAGLVRRGVARLLDSLVLGAVAAGAAWPLVPVTTAHVQAKVDAARGSGRATTVWLVDATVAGHLGLVLGAVLLFGVFYEVLPTARWGRTPGKKLLGVRVLATATLRPPAFGAALRRWLVYAFLGLPGSLWCLVDRPRRQAWHDKAAKTYVAR
ncbi:RDD family protein [Streptomyces xanthophaeus]